MYCPSCGSEIAVELKYCNRCGANLSVSLAESSPPIMMAPVKLTVPSIVLGITLISGLGIIFGAASQFALVGIHPAAIVWMVLAGGATLFGCTAMMIKFWTKLLTLQREVIQVQPQKPIPTLVERRATPQFPPRLEPVGSVTENTTRTFSPIYREPSDREPR